MLHTANFTYLVLLPKHRDQYQIKEVSVEKFGVQKPYLSYSLMFKEPHRVIKCLLRNTVEPLYLSGHPWGMGKCLFNRSCPLNTGLLTMNFVCGQIHILLKYKYYNNIWR